MLVQGWCFDDEMWMFGGGLSCIAHQKCAFLRCFVVGLFVRIVLAWLAGVFLWGLVGEEYQQG